MSMISKKLKVFFASVVVIGVICAGFYFVEMKGNEPEQEIAKDIGLMESNLELPKIVEKRIVTKDEVKSKIYEIGELSTYCGEYSALKSVDESRYIDKIRILGTKNTITIQCRGTVKIGYDFSNIGVTVGEDIIYVTIPDAYVTDNYIILDSVVCEEKNSILNPIEFAQYKELLKEIEEEGLADVERQGIYEKADENFENIIRVFLGEFEDYEIEFI